VRSSRVLVVLVLAGLLGAAGASGARAATSTASGSRYAAWLTEINRYRLAARLAPVVAQPAWVTGLRLHLNYLHNTPRKFKAGPYASAHAENPFSPWYTPAGALEARSSDIGYGDTPVDGIDDWWVAPFHAVGMLRPQLRQVGFALNRYGRAGLDVIQGVNRGVPDGPRPVLFPPLGATTDLVSFDGEFPDPRETCGWKGTTGLPLIALLPSAPSTLLNATLTHGRRSESSGAGSICVVDEHTFRTSDAVYGPNGRSILAGDHAVFLLPRHPLTNGTYVARIRQFGRPDIAWAFKVRSRAGALKRRRHGVLSRHSTTTIGSARCAGPHRCYVRARVTARLRGRHPTRISRWGWTIRPGHHRTLRLGLTRRGAYAVFRGHRLGVAAHVRVTQPRRRTIGRAWAVRLRYGG
jgi:hypothetical protein